MLNWRIGWKILAGRIMPPSILKVRESSGPAQQPTKTGVGAVWGWCLGVTMGDRPPSWEGGAFSGTKGSCRGTHNVSSILMNLQQKRNEIQQEGYCRRSRDDLEGGTCITRGRLKVENVEEDERLNLRIREKNHDGIGPLTWFVICV